MPDGDVVASRIHHRWRSTYDGLKGDATPQELAPRALKALTDSFRSNGGLPGLPAYAALVEARVAGTLSQAQARVQARLVARAQEQTPFTMSVLAAVLRCVADPVPASAVLQPGALTVAEAVCHTLMDVELLERVRAHLVSGRFPDHGAFDRAVDALREELAPGVSRIAESLQRDASAVRLRAVPPRRRARRKSMSAILDTSIL